MNSRSLVFVVLSVILVFSGCTTTQKGAATGAVVGGGLGAIIGHQSGKTGAGAAVGAAVGGIGGAIVGEQLDNKFCPTCGRRFTGSVQYCPYDGTTLKNIDK